MDKDLDELSKIYQDSEVVRFLMLPTAWGDEQRAGYIQRTHDAWEAGNPRWAIADPRTDLLLGGIGVTMMVPGEASVMYFVAAQARGHGIATTACREAARFAFEKLGVERLTWEAVVGNHYSRLVALKVGFEIEGVARKGANQRGVRRDQWRGSLFPSELREDNDLPPNFERIRRQASFFTRKPQEVSAGISGLTLRPLADPNNLGTVPSIRRSKAQREFDHGTAVNYCLYLNGEIIDVTLGLWIDQRDNAIAEIKLYGELDDNQGHIYSSAVERLIDFAFDELLLERVEWVGNPKDSQVLKTLEAARFETEGLLANRLHLGGSQRGAAQVLSRTRP